MSLFTIMKLIVGNPFYKPDTLFGTLWVQQKRQRKNGGGNPDPLKKYLDQSVSLDEFLSAIEGKSYNEVINQLRDRSMTSAGSQPGGPSIRYVRNPHDGNVIDMRHMLIVGYQYSETLGSLLEVAQWMRGLPSGMDHQDFYSNRLGSEFMQRWTISNAIWPSQFSEHLKLFFAKPKDYNHGWGIQH